MNPQEHEALRYACADSDYTLRLYFKFNNWFDRFLPQHRVIVEQLESPTAVYCGLMKYNGVPIDHGLMFERQKKAEGKISEIKREIDIITGRRGDRSERLHLCFQAVSVQGSRPACHEKNGEKPGGGGRCSHANA